jgi:hypothetical protein
MDDQGTRFDSTMSWTGDELRADALMPAQFYPARRGSASMEPIMRVMGGVLADAVRSLQRNFDAQTAERGEEFREARHWIFNAKSDGPFSFENVCEALDIDPRRLRELIIRWEENRHPGDKPRMIRRPAVNRGGRVQSGRAR